jgi:hypothetical protein
LGRPTVDTISNSTIANLKELRPGTVRILFVFDPYRVTKGRVSQIERGLISTQDVLARYAEALGGRLQQAIYFPSGDIAVISRVTATGAAPAAKQKAGPRRSSPAKHGHADAGKRELANASVQERHQIPS